MSFERNKIIVAIDDLKQEVYDIATSRGWHKPGVQKTPLELDLAIQRQMNNIHGEVSEINEAYRLGNPESEKIPGFSCAEEELADVFIRCCDFSKAHNLRLGEAVIAKMDYNRGREYRHGGKAY